MQHGNYFLLKSMPLLRRDYREACQKQQSDPAELEGKDTGGNSRWCHYSAAPWGGPNPKISQTLKDLALKLNLCLVNLQQLLTWLLWQETSSPEELPSMNKVYLQNATGVKACWCKYSEWPDELIRATLRVLCLCQLISAEAEGGRVCITADEKTSSLPSGKFIQCWFGGLCHRWVDSSWGRITQTQPFSLSHCRWRIYRAVASVLKILSVAYARILPFWSALLLNCNYLTSFFFSFLLFWPIMSWGWGVCFGVAFVVGGFYFNLPVSYSFLVNSLEDLCLDCIARKAIPAHCTRCFLIKQTRTVWFWMQV